MVTLTSYHTSHIFLFQYIRASQHYTASHKGPGYRTENTEYYRNGKGQYQRMNTSIIISILHAYSSYGINILSITALEVINPEVIYRILPHNIIILSIQLACWFSELYLMIESGYIEMPRMWIDSFLRRLVSYMGSDRYAVNSSSHTSSLSNKIGFEGVICVQWNLLATRGCSNQLTFTERTLQMLCIHEMFCLEIRFRELSFNRVDEDDYHNYGRRFCYTIMLFTFHKIRVLHFLSWVGYRQVIQLTDYMRQAGL